MIETIRKRSGRVVPFDSRKVIAVVMKAIDAVTEVPKPAWRDIEVGVVNIASGAAGLAEAKHGTEVTVEQMQDCVEAALIMFGERAAARAFMTYRDERAEARRRAILTPEIMEAFRLGAEAMGENPLRMFQFYDKFSRWNGERRETWQEAIRRSISFLKELVEATGRHIPEADWAFLEEMMLTLAALPSMRLVAMAGPAARRDHVSIYNCSFQVIDCLEAFRESLLISMAGCGDGYSVESQFVRKLPFVRHQRNAEPDVFVIPDTAQGWGDAVLHGLERWFDGHDVRYDYSELRPAGALLRVKGGRSSGPGPLRGLLGALRRVVLSRQGMQVRPVDANDMMCFLGDAGNSGGQRRAAKLSLSDWDDAEMELAKQGEYWDPPLSAPWRANANNSAVWPSGGPNQLDYLGQMTRMFKSGSGERGIFSRDAALRTMPERRRDFLIKKGAHVRIGVNPCGEIVLQDKQFCNLSISVARPQDTFEDLERKVRAATIFGTIQSTALHFPDLRPEWRKNCADERLLGVDITGQMDCRVVRDPEVMARLRSVARSTNQEYAAVLDIPESMAITTCKPNGDSSAFLYTGPGCQAWKFRYGIRNARVNAKSPVYRVFRACGVPMDPENGQDAATATTWVVHIPMAAPEGSVVLEDQTAIDQLEHWLMNKLHWTDHNPSCTINYGPEEMIDVIEWVWAHREVIGGLSFLPRDASIYRQKPYEETTKEEYERALAAFPSIDWSLIAVYETSDQTTQAQTKACGANGCD